MKEKSRNKLVFEVCLKLSSSCRLQTERAVKIFLTKEFQVLSKTKFIPCELAFDRGLKAVKDSSNQSYFPAGETTLQRSVNVYRIVGIHP